MFKGEMKLMTGQTFPRGLGHDFAGVVEAVGPHVTRLKVGDEVYGAVGLKAAGAFAEALVTEDTMVFLKPQPLSFGKGCRFAHRRRDGLDCVDRQGSAASWPAGLHRGLPWGSWAYRSANRWDARRRGHW